jgi:hypothetical protein
LLYFLFSEETDRKPTILIIFFLFKFLGSFQII